MRQRPETGALRATRAVLRVLTVLNLGLGALIGVMLLASLLAESWVMTALGVRPGEGRAALVLGMRLMAVLGIAAVPLAHVVLTRLRDIVETVRQGDAFIAGNAARLRTIAWAVLGLEVLHLGVGAVATAASSPAQGLDIGWELSPTRWVAVLLLFVLAQVFEEGARMREDLEGTV
jgi:hypothetical protein